MKDLQAHEARAIQERAMDAINKLQSIVHECEQIYYSRRYIMSKAEDAALDVKIVVGIANGEYDNRPETLAEHCGMRDL